MSAVDLLSRRQRGFTLIEITIVVCLILLLLGIAVPSFSGQLSRQRLEKAFDRFDALAAAAQHRSVAEHRAYALVWLRDGSVGLYPADLPAAERKKHDPAALLNVASPLAAHGERYLLVRDASLNGGNPASVWTFWPTGNCEPVVVRYDGPSGHWEAVYNPLSARATFNQFIAQ